MNMKSQVLRLCLFAALTILFIGTVVIIAVVVIKSKDTSSNQQLKNTCLSYQVSSVEAPISPSHQRCNQSLEVSDGCYTSNANAWRLFNNNTDDWFHVISNVAVSLKNASSVVVSPLFRKSQEICSLRVSFNFKSNSPIRGFIQSREGVTANINIASDYCDYGSIDDPKFLSNVSLFRIILVSNSPILTKGGVSGSVTLHNCFEFEEIDHFSTPTKQPKFLLVPRGTRNFCSSEIDVRVMCDWWNVQNLGNEHFKRDEKHSCVSTGVTYHMRDRSIYFFILNGTYSDSRGYMISPIIEGGAPTFLLSFWYIAQCTGSKIRVYVVPSIYYLEGVKAGLRPVYEINEPKNSFEWTFVTTEIPVSSSYKTFQVVIEGVASLNGNCSGHLCKNDKMLSKGQPDTPILALDDIAIEEKYKACFAANNSNMEICSLDKITSSHCSWTSSFPNTPGIPLSVRQSVLTHWKKLNAGECNGASENGRGLVWKLNENSITNEDLYIRSPQLITDNSCSCLMSFAYFFNGYFTPRLQLNLVVTDPTSNQTSFVPQWSIFGPQGNEWVQSNATLNLPARSPFFIEMRVTAVANDGFKACLDDFAFINCDFRIFSGA